MFANTPDVDADIKMMMEVRAELGENLKHLDMIMVAGGPFPSFVEKFKALSEDIAMAKEHLVQLVWF